MTTISLTADDFSVACHLAAERTIESLRQNRTDTLYDKTWDHAYHIHLLGSCGEIALAKFLWTYPQWTVCEFSGMRSDLSLGPFNVEVRHRSRHDWDLKVVEKDPDERVYVLTTGLPPDITVVGWLYGYEAKLPEYLKDYGEHGKPAYFIPQDRLRPIEELRK